MDNPISSQIHWIPVNYSTIEPKREKKKKVVQKSKKKIIRKEKKKKEILH